MARTFGSSRTSAVGRGAQLFSCLENFFDLGLECAKQNNELLAAEMWALQLQVPYINAMLSPDDCRKVHAEVRKLALGNCDERAREFIKKQTAFASTRSEQAQHLDNRSDMKQKLREIPERDLKAWLNAESIKPIGAALLAGHIVGYFPEATRNEAVEYAVAIQAEPRSVTSVKVWCVQTSITTGAAPTEGPIRKTWLTTCIMYLIPRIAKSM